MELRSNLRGSSYLSPSLGDPGELKNTTFRVRIVHSNTTYSEVQLDRQIIEKMASVDDTMLE